MGSSSSAGILLLLLAIAGLLALFSGNLDRLIGAIAGPAGGAEGLVRRDGAAAFPKDPAVRDRTAAPAPATPRGGDQEAP